MNISYKWSHTICDLFWPASFTSIMPLRFIHIVTGYQYFIPFYGWVMIHVGEGNGNPLQYSCLENPRDGGAWWAAVHGVAKSWTRLSDFTFTFHFHALETEMATHSSVLAWRIPGTEECGRRPSLGSHRVGYDWSDLAAMIHVYVPEFAYPFVCWWMFGLFLHVLATFCA